MGRKRDLVWDNYYAPQNPGFRNNPPNNLHEITKRMYRRHLTELSINRFKWTGLPKSIDPRFMELELFRKALVVFYKDYTFDRYLCVAASGNGGLNHYENPVSFTTYGNKYISKTLKAADVVPIWSNMLREPDIDVVYVYSNRLAELDRTIEIASKNLRRTKVIVAEENQRTSWQNFQRQVDEGVEVIYGSSALDVAQVQALDVGGDPVGLLNLQISKSKLWNEAMTMLGINNANQDKKERVVSDEVEANNEQVFATRGIALNSRKLACELINDKFKMPDGTPLEIDVDYNTDSQPNTEMPDSGSMTLGLTEAGAGA